MSLITERSPLEATAKRALSLSRGRPRLRVEGRQQRMGRSLSVFLLSLTLFGAGVSALPAQAPPATDEGSVTQLVRRLARNTADAQESEINSTIEVLRSKGTNALPVIREAMESTEPRFRLNLIRVVGGINGDEATEVLFSTAVTDPDRNVSRTALNSIDNRVIRRQPTSEEWGMIKERVSNGSSVEARQWAYVLARSGLVEDPELVREIATRFLADVKTPPILATNRAYSGYIQGLPLALNSYLRAFFFMDSALVIPVLREALEAATDKDAVMWLTVALGMAGDERVTDELRTIIEDKTEDASTRAEALRAYARAARQNAIPLLEFMLQDKTPGPDPVRPPVAAVAGQELYWLRNPDRRKEIWGK